MATKTKKKEVEREPTEQEIVLDWRKESFKDRLKSVEFSPKPKVLQSLVDSTSSPHDLDRLLKRGCPPELAIKILV